MRREQRFFHRESLFLAGGFVLVSLGFSLSLAGVSPAAAGEKVLIADGRLLLELPDGWSATELNAGNVLAGYATQDQRTSAFFREMDPGLGGSMRDLLDATIANFEESFRITGVDEAKSGQVNGPNDKKWPAIFTTVEGVVGEGRGSFEMKFYLLIFDTEEDLYFMQASTTRPVREAREQQIYEMIRSIVAKT